MELYLSVSVSSSIQLFYITSSEVVLGQKKALKSIVPSRQLLVEVAAMMD
jgi:hypothetical protein